ncbi:MAG: diadenylate cyclase CdaA [bacterium]
MRFFDFILFRFDFFSVSIADVIDITIVAIIFYNIYSILRGTRGLQITIGIFLLILISLAADWWNLRGLSWIISTIKTVGIVIFFILFQPEIRRALTKIGQIKLISLIFREDIEDIPVAEICRGAMELSRRGIGGLIVIKQEVGLKNYIETGKVIDSIVCAELITNIFTTNTPLHDGAVIINGDRITAAACVLPLLQNPPLELRNLGMRHRAALGLAGESDAIIIIVSEETGNISIAYKDIYYKSLNPHKLEERLRNLIEV